jgi:hypothetical protein
MRIQNLKGSIKYYEKQLEKPWLFEYRSVKARIEELKAAVSKHLKTETK